MQGAGTSNDHANHVASQNGQKGLGSAHQQHAGNICLLYRMEFPTPQNTLSAWWNDLSSGTEGAATLELMLAYSEGILGTLWEVCAD